MLALAVTACSADLTLPEGTQVLCTNDGACPDGRVCEAGYCIAPDLADRTPPKLVAIAVASPLALLLTFDERLDPESATTLERYSAQPPLAFTSAVLGAEEQSVVLAVEQQDAVTYELVVNDVRDAAGNVIAAPNDRAQFVGVKPTPDTSAPQLLVPTENQRLVRQTTTVLRWTPRTGANTYTVDVAYDAAFARPIAGSPFTVSATRPGGAPEPSYPLTLPAAVTYFWRVRADITEGPANTGQFDAIGDALHVYCERFTPCDDSGQAGNTTRPFRTINRALAVARADGITRVNVAHRGVDVPYSEVIVLVDGVSLYGGYDSGFTLRSEPTRIKGDGAIAVYGERIGTPTVMDNFAIAGGVASTITTVRLFASNAFTLSASTVDGGGDEVGQAEPIASVGVYIEASGEPAGAQPTLSGVTITTRHARARSIGVQTVRSNVVIDGVTVATGATTETFDGSTALLLEGGAVVRNSVLYAGSAENATSACVRLAILNDSRASRIERNICGTAGARETVGVRAEPIPDSAPSPVIINNVIAIEASTTTSVGVQLSRGALSNNTIGIGTCVGCARFPILTIHDNGELTIANNIAFTRGGSANGACMRMHTAPTQHPPPRIENNLFFDCPGALAEVFRSDTNTAAAVANLNDPGSYAVFVATQPQSATGNFTDGAGASYFEGPDDYHLNAGTPASVSGGGRDATSTTYGTVKGDLDGNARTCVAPGVCFSVGAYERDE